MTEHEKLSQSARRIIKDSKYKKFISIASMWEIAVKSRIGKLPIPNGVSSAFSKAESSGFGIAEINRQCIEIYNSLPLLHRDPFDGIIIATARAENFTIVTADENIQKYDISWIW
jgi:PIN domain nuclease of toxin-antitoxin system